MGFVGKKGKNNTELKDLKTKCVQQKRREGRDDFSWNFSYEDREEAKVA